MKPDQSSKALPHALNFHHGKNQLQIYNLKLYKQHYKDIQTSSPVAVSSKILLLY